MFYKTVSLILLFLIICVVSGERDPDSEIEYIKEKGPPDPQIKKLKNDLKNIQVELKKLRGILEAAKNNMGDGPNSDINIQKILAMPQNIANLTDQLDSTMNALEKKELLT